MISAVTTLRAQVVIRNVDPSENVVQAYIDPATLDTIPIVKLKQVYCFNRKRFFSKNHEREFWRMVNDVKKTLPIAKAGRNILVQVYDTLQYLPNEKAQKKYFKSLEKELFAQYKPQLKRLNYRQGKLLVRLVDRETHRQTYSLIREFLGKTRAFFWQSFGSLFGVSLKGQWEPDGKDKELEDICIQVEQGLL